MQSLRTYVCLLALAACAHAQQSITFATLSGRVEDPSGATIANAAVRVVETATGLSRSVVTDDQGRFRFDALAAGACEVRVEHPQFAVVVETITLSVGQALDLQVRLPLASSSQLIEVQALAPAVEAARTQTAETVTPREIDSLPLNGRNSMDLSLLVPGVSRTNTGTNQRFAETSAVPGTGISVAGQRNLNNGFLIDGLSAKDDAAGLAGAFYSQEVIREFQVVTSGGIAEFGRASAGVVNVITQSGTNSWHGRLYTFARNQAFDARNPLAGHKDPLTQAQYGATAGGPLRRDRTFLFTNFEQTRQRAETLVTIAPANAGAINTALLSSGYPGAPVTAGGIPTSLDTTNYFARLDQHLSAANLLTARYSLYDVSSVNARTAGGLNAASRGAALSDRDQTIAVSDQATLSPRTIHELRAQFTRSSLGAPVNDPIGPAVNISGVASFGTSTASPTGRDLDVFEISDSIATVRGYHSLKAGIDYQENRTSIAFPGAQQGVYSFSSLGNFLAGRYTTFQQAFGPAVEHVPNANAGAYLQEEWRPRPSLTVNAGLRYDFSALPDPIQPDTHNLSPRLGIAYSPGEHKFVVRAAFGMYYGNIPLRAVSNALQRDGVNFKTAVLSFGQSGAPAFPAILSAFPAEMLTSITTIEPRIHSDYSLQANVQVEREIAPGSVLSIGYMRLRGAHLILSRNLNVPSLSAADSAALGVANLGRPDPRFANISQYESAGDSYYNGMTLAFTHKASRWGSFRAAYTLSKAIDDTGNFFFSTPQDNFNLRGDRGLSDNDQRHRISASGTISAPWKNWLLSGWQLSSILSYASAVPFNVQTGNDRNNDTNVNDRPIGVGRNTGRGFNSLTLDARLSRRFALREKAGLELLAESFNSLNRANWQFPNNTFGNGSSPLPSFGRPTAAGDARQIQLGVRLSF